MEKENTSLLSLKKIFLYLEYDGKPWREDTNLELIYVRVEPPQRNQSIPLDDGGSRGRHGLGSLISSNYQNLGTEPAKAVQLRKGASASLLQYCDQPHPRASTLSASPTEATKRSDVRRKRILVTTKAACCKVQLILFSNGHILQEGRYPCRNNGKTATQNEPISVLKNIFSRNFLSHDSISTTQNFIRLSKSISHLDALQNTGGNNSGSIPLTIFKKPNPCLSLQHYLICKTQNTQSPELY